MGSIPPTFGDRHPSGRWGQDNALRSETGREPSRLARRLARERMRSRRVQPAVLRLVRLALAGILAVFFVSLFATTAGAVASAFAVSRYLDDLPSTENIGQRDIDKSTKIYDRNGILLYELFNSSSKDGGRRSVISLGEVPPYVIWATLATEDADFFSNPGFDIRGIARAGIEELNGRLRGGQGKTGGSTITQQYIRNVLFDYQERFDRSYSRKLKEIVLAFQLSTRFTKDQILEGYLNEINYGNLSYGIEAAAEGYFGKAAKDLSLAEAAMLAGLPQAPSELSPLNNPAAARERQLQVLGLMVRHGFIDEETAAKAMTEELTYRLPKYEIKAPHFVFYVRDLLEEKYGGPALYRRGFSVYTTLDYRMQQIAEDVVKKNIDEIRKYKATNAALVALDPKTGQILALVGSADYWDTTIDGQVNVALMERQPGSSIKPITYVAAFAKGWTPGTMVLDSPFSVRDGNKFWTPMNYDNAFHGAMTVREALGNSWNIPAVRTLQFVGVETMIEWARKMGITSFKDPKRYGLSITLGGGEVKLLDHAGAYAVFAAAGIRNPPTPFLRITDDEGNVVEEYQPRGERVMSAELAYLISDVLSDPQARRVTYGLGGPLSLSRVSAGKTGTTDDHRDGWTMGYTPYLVTGVWVGNSNNTPMAGLYGSRSAMPIWHDFMEAAFQFFPNDKSTKFERPPGIANESRCTTRDPVSGQCTAYSRDLYIKGFEPPAPRFDYKTVLVTKKGGKLASKECPADEIEQRTYLVPLPGVVLTAEEKREAEIPTEVAECAKLSITPVPAVGPASGALPPLAIAPPLETGGSSGGVAISAPAPGATVRGNLAIGGSASVPNFAAYKVEVSPGLNGAQFTTLTESSTLVEGGYLATFPTERFRNGSYRIILSVFDRSGVARSASTTVVVAN